MFTILIHEHNTVRSWLLLFRTVEMYEKIEKFIIFFYFLKIFQSDINNIGIVNVLLLSLPLILSILL